MMNGDRVSVLQGEKVPWVDGGDVCTTVWMSLTPPNHARTNGRDGKFCVHLPWNMLLCSLRSLVRRGRSCSRRPLPSQSCREAGISPGIPPSCGLASDPWRQLAAGSQLS